MMQKSQRDHKSHEVPQNIFSDGTFVVVDKPLKWTSFDVVNKFRWLLCKKLGVKRLKVGHAGTLDPLATGVGVLCTGRYTKRIEEVQKLPKEYTATLKLGATTPSFDLESEEDATFSTEHITREKVEEVLKQYEGVIPQVPPIFSAVKVVVAVPMNWPERERGWSYRRRRCGLTVLSYWSTAYPTFASGWCVAREPISGLWQGISGGR